MKHRPSDRKQDTCSYSEGRLIAGQLVTSCSTPPTVSDTSSLKAMFALMQEVTQKRAPGINRPPCAHVQRHLLQMFYLFHVWKLKASF